MPSKVLNKDLGFLFLPYGIKILDNKNHHNTYECCKKTPYRDHIIGAEKEQCEENGCEKNNSDMSCFFDA